MPPPPRRPRSRGFAPPELRGTLGTLLRTTLMQARDALERGAREGRARFDDARLERRRDDALAELGAVVLELVRRGEAPELESIPEIGDAIAAVEAIEERLNEREEPARREFVAPSRRTPFDRGRARDLARDDLARDDDGTVSSAGWRPPPAKKPNARVWGKPEPAPRDEEPPAPREPARKGGITFPSDGDEDDLAEYMHPDDVPAKK